MMTVVGCHLNKLNSNEVSVISSPSSKKVQKVKDRRKRKNPPDPNPFGVVGVGGRTFTFTSLCTSMLCRSTSWPVERE
jgi:hypothetical protein